MTLPASMSWREVLELARGAELGAQLLALGQGSFQLVSFNGISVQLANTTFCVPSVQCGGQRVHNGVVVRNVLGQLDL